MTTTKHPTRTGTFPIPSQYFGEQAAAHLRIANSPGYCRHPAARAAELFEVKHYSELKAQALYLETMEEKV